MRIFIQRVSSAKVEVDSNVVGSIGRGLCVFVGFSTDDQLSMISELAQKLLHLRIFPDSSGKMHHSVLDIEGEVLIVSQFTLYAECSGRRPSFTKAMEPTKAKQWYDMFLHEVTSLAQKSQKKLGVKQGVFGANMQVFLTNDGPVSILLEK